ncbi:hypothetical protein [Hymenobacter terricola]|uniref:hypothetical protein n=1 Tax=Hymenobacter terricola TaxID=2819236 RepID=UPI001B3042A8|nr:hypothetical protein [Hymenobacter terricola]
MLTKATISRWLLPALLLAGLTLTSCGERKDCDPHPKNKCGTTAPPVTPSGPS